MDGNHTFNSRKSGSNVSMLEMLSITRECPPAKLKWHRMTSLWGLSERGTGVKSPVVLWQCMFFVDWCFLYSLTHHWNDPWVMWHVVANCFCVRSLLRYASTSGNTSLARGVSAFIKISDKLSRRLRQYITEKQMRFTGGLRWRVPALFGPVPGSHSKMYRGRLFSYRSSEWNWCP